MNVKRLNVLWEGRRGEEGQIPVQKTDMISPPPTTSIHIKYDDSWANSKVHASSTACFCLLHCGIYAGARQSSPTFQQFQIWARKRRCSNAFIYQKTAPQSRMHSIIMRSATFWQHECIGSMDGRRKPSRIDCHITGDQATVCCFFLLPSL